MQILIIEDETVAARRLERLSRDALGDALTGLHHAFDLEDARTLLDAQPIDLILLDLNLAGDDGFDLFQTDIGLARVIVVSAFPDRAIEAFGHAVLDFVPKPVEPDRLARALDRALDNREDGRGQKRLIVRNPGRADFVDPAHIIRIAGADDYCEILLANARTLLHDETLAELERKLPAGFMRVHRSYLANLDYAVSLEQDGSGYRLHQADGIDTPVSRRRARDVRTALTERFGSG